VNESLVVLATIVEGPRCILGLAPVSSLHWMRIEPDSHQVQAPRQLRTRPYDLATPENVGTLLKVQWLPTAWHQSRIGSPRRRPGSGEQRSRSSVHSGWWFAFNLIGSLAALRASLLNQNNASHRCWFSFEHVIASTRRAYAPAS
jgi:hypothetical protein